MKLTHPSRHSVLSHLAKSATCLLALTLLVVAPQASADVIINSDFNSGTLTGWTPVANGTGTWNVTDFGGSIGNAATYNSGSTITSGGTLSQSFGTISSALQLNFDGGWLYGGVGYGAASLGVTLLDANGNGYAFTDRRNDGGYGAIWYAVTNYTFGPEHDFNIDTSQDAIAVSGTLASFSLSRTEDGVWTFSGSTWNGSLTFTDNAITSFTQLNLLAENGADNSISVVYDNVVLQTVPEPGTLLLGTIGLAGVIGYMHRRRC